LLGDLELFKVHLEAVWPSSLGHVSEEQEADDDQVQELDEKLKVKSADLVIVFECSVEVQQDLERGIGHYNNAQLLQHLDFQIQGLLRVCGDVLVVIQELLVDRHLLFQTVESEGSKPNVSQSNVNLGRLPLNS
jgi:hypothetical protein